MRKFKRLTMTLALLLTAVTGAWADGIVCTASDLGKVLCTDGSIYENVSAATTAGKTAAAVIAYVDETNRNGLALALADEGEMNWSTAQTTCAAHTPAFTGGTWKLASKDEWSNMISAAGSYSALRDGFSSVGGTNMKKNYYWSSTEYSSGMAWYCNFNDGYWGYVNTVLGEFVRACLAFDIAEPTEWSLKPDADKKVWTLAEMPASNIELQVEYEPTKVTIAAKDNAMGTVEVAGQSKVEWTADTWKGWTQDIKEHTVDDITITGTKYAYIEELKDEGKYKNSLSFGVIYSSDQSTVTFSTTGDPFSRIEFTMIDDYSESNPNNPHILPLDNWTFEGKSAVWEGEATKSLTLQSCSTKVSKITFFKGDIPDGVTVNGDGTFTVAKTATVTLKATPKEGYKFLYWEDDQSNTNPVREVTIESGMADKTYKAVFAEITYNVTFVEGTNLDEWSATPATEVKKGDKVDIKYTGEKKVIGVKVEKKEAEPVADIIWDGTNVTDLNVESTYASYTKEGVKLSGNADQVQVKWNNSAYLGTPGMEFITMESGGFTFTAPTGKKFTKIEMKAVGSSGWAQKNLGTGWAYNTGTVTWNGSAASTVKLLKDADMFSGDFISSIAFYLSE